MGQKVHPYGFRLGFNKTWRSRWYSDKESAKLLHEDLKLPPEAIEQIADDTRNERADQFGVRQVELYHNPEGQVYCLLDGPDEDAIRKHHVALGEDCGAVHRVDGIT